MQHGSVLHSRCLTAVAIAALALIQLAACGKVDPCVEARIDSRPLSVPNEPAPKSAVSVYVLGDWGTGSSEQAAVADLLRSDLEQLARQTTNEPLVIGTGDNVYPAGLEGGWEAEKNNRRLHQTFGSKYRKITFNNRPVTFHIVPGNHDHEGDVLLQETLAEMLYNGSDGETAVWKFYPAAHPSVPDTNDRSEYESLQKLKLEEVLLPQVISGPPGPFTIAAIDSETLLRLYADANLGELAKYWQALAAIFKQAEPRWRIIVGHHPIASHGHHSRPLSKAKNLKRRIFGHSLKHLAHPAYRRFAADLRAFMAQYQIALYLSGHDHDLQLLDIGPGLQIVSGSAGETRPVWSCKDTIYAVSAPGFVRIDFSEERAWIGFHWLESSKAQTRAFVLDAEFNRPGGGSL